MRIKLAFVDSTAYDEKSVEAQFLKIDQCIPRRLYRGDENIAVGYQWMRVEAATFQLKIYFCNYSEYAAFEADLGFVSENLLVHSDYIRYSILPSKINYDGDLYLDSEYFGSKFKFVD